MACVSSQVPVGRQNEDSYSESNHGASQSAPLPQLRASPHDFDVLLARALENKFATHVAGDGTLYRQALAIPVLRRRCSNQVVSIRPGNLLNLLVERSNGQLISLCLLDTKTRQLRIDTFVEKLEEVLPACIETGVDIHALEDEVAQRTGYQISIERGSVLLGSSCFYSQALPELATSVLNVISSMCKSHIEPKIEQSRSRLLKGLSLQLESALETFWLNLDSRIISAICRSGNTVSSTSYNRYRQLGNAARHRRLQAAEAFPLVGGLLIDTNRQFAHIRRSVDQKLPLIPAVAKTLKVSQEVARWMKDIEDIEYVGRTWLGKIDSLAKYLSYVCPEHRPKSIDDWFSFHDFVSTINELETRTEGSPFTKRVCVLPGLLAQAGKSGWHQASIRLVSLGADVTDLADMADLIDEIVQVLAEEIGEGGTLSEVLVDDLLPVVKELYCSIGMTRQLQASLQWHQMMLEPDGPVEGNPSSTSVPSLWSWPPPFEGLLEIEGHTAVCLTNPTQLKEEGKHMQHCVRNYTDHCLYYGSNIISIRSEDGQRLSTLELHLIGNKSEAPTFVVRQHRGPNNSEPPQKSINVVKILLPILNGSGVLAKRQDLNRALQERRAIRRDRPAVSVDALRIKRLRRALKVHVGYERFYDEALQFLGGGR